MTDPTSRPPVVGSSTTVEDRLRTSLRVVADSEPVTSDVEELRRRSTGAVIALDRPPRANRARLLAAAALVVVIAATGAFLAIRDRAEPGERATADGPAPTAPAGPTTPADRADPGSGAPPASDAALALIEFARAPNDERFAALPLAEAVAVGLWTDLPVDQGRIPADELRDPARWDIDLAGAFGRDGTTSALSLLAEVDGYSTSSPYGDAWLECPRPSEDGTDVPDAALIQPTGMATGEMACLESFSVIVTVDDAGDITSVLVRLYEP